MHSHVLSKCWKTSLCVKAEDIWLHQRREKMLFAFKLLRNISLASLSAECQDSVCKQSVHVRVVTWRKLLSCCPHSIIPEVNPDIDTYRRPCPSHWRPSAVCHSRILSLRNYTSWYKMVHATRGRKKKSTSHIWFYYIFIRRIIKCWSVLHRGSGAYC